MSDGAGSYRALGSAAVESETDRLRRQAAAVWTRSGRRCRRRAGAGAAAARPRLRPGRPARAAGPRFGRAPFGVDLNQGLLRQVRAGQVARADGARLPFQDGVFDFVLMRLVLRHAPARGKLIDEAARVLRTGGILCAVDVDEAATAFDPEPASWPALKQALAASALRRGGDPFVGRRLPRLLAAAGLVDVTTVGLPVSTGDLPPRAFIETMLAPAARSVDPDLLDPAAVRRGWDERRMGFRRRIRLRSRVDGRSEETG